MKKTTKSFVLLCSAACLFTLALAGCKKKKSTPVDPTGQPTASTSVPVQVTHTVTFNTQGGSAVQAQTVKHGEKAVKPADPRKAEDAQYTYTFKGWYEEKECVVAFDFNTEITADWTIYAGWNKTEKGGEPTEPVGPTVEPTEPVGPTTEEPTGQPGTDTPITEGYAVNIGGVYYALEETDLNPDFDGTAVAKFYAGGLNVEGGAAIAFTLDGEAIQPGADEGDNNGVGEWPSYSVHNDAINAEIYLKKYEDGGYSFWLTGYEAGGDPTVQPTVPAGEGFGLLIDGTYVPGVKQDEPDYQGRDQYLISGYEFEEGMTFALYDAANQASWVEPLDPYSFNQNPDAYIQVGEGSYLVLQDFVADVYIKLAWEDNVVYFGLLSEPVDPTDQPSVQPVTGEFTYTVTNNPEWITNDGAVIFAWVWSPSDGGSWKSLEFEGTDLHFQVSEELTGFLLARCHPDTTEPNWAEKENVAGKVWNQTADVNCVSGVYSYTAQWE